MQQAAAVEIALTDIPECLILEDRRLTKGLMNIESMIRPMRVFQRMQPASATIKGLEVMHVIRLNHCILRAPGAAAETRLVNQLFGLCLNGLLG